MNYGILSTASIVGRYIQGIRESKDGVVYGIASRTLEKAKEAAEQFNIEHYYANYEELMQDPNIDVVYIPTMNGIHYENAKMALSYHKHVIVEKPFVLHSNQVKELFAYAKKQNCFLMEAQKSVFLPTTIKLKELLKKEIVGPIKYIELKAGFPSRFPEGHWMFDLSKGGGALFGSASYTVEFISYLFDHTDYTINASFIPSPYSADDLVNFHLKFDDILVSSTIAMNVALDCGAVFYGQKGWIFVPNYWKSKELTIHYVDHEEKISFPYTSEFTYEVDHINECIQKGLLTSPIMDENKTYTTVKIVEELYQLYIK